jgi:hypothetical protein
MKVDVARLRMASEKLWKHLEELGIDSIDIPYDYYWSIPEEQTYQLEIEPTRHEIGQLSDDWQDLLQLIEHGHDAITHDFVRLSAILRVVGEQIVS